MTILEGQKKSEEKILKFWKQRKIPEKTRKILLLKAEGYKYEEIAEKMNLTLSGVKMQIKRSIEKLQIQLFPVTFFFFITTI